MDDRSTVIFAGKRKPMIKMRIKPAITGVKNFLRLFIIRILGVNYSVANLKKNLVNHKNNPLTWKTMNDKIQAVNNVYDK